MKFNYKNEAFLVGLILCMDFLFLLYGISTLSISHGEAYIYFYGKDFVHFLVRASTFLFGQNDYALRLPFVFFHIFSTILLYKISKKYLKRKSDRLFSVVVYILLPGTNSAALVVNSSQIVIFLSLFFIYLYEQNKQNLAYFILIISLFVDNSFAIFYLSLLFFAIYKKDNKLLSLSLVLFGLCMYLWGFDTGGKPKDYFVQTLAVYIAIFSPCVFLYFFYTEYRIFLKEEKNILWFISFVSFLFSILLSFRQKVMLEDFAPFAIIATPLMVRVFLSSYRVRIPELRYWHKIIFLFVFGTLVANFIVIYFNKPLYLIFKNPKKHFTYRYDFAKQVSNKLKSLGIKRVKCFNEDFALRLKFYGIKNGDRYILTRSNNHKLYDVTISYNKKPIFRVYVSKIHKIY